MKQSVRLLGAYVDPKLEWIVQFKVIKDKLHRDMSRLRSTLIPIVNAYVFFNMCLITQVHFECEIIVLLPKQEEMLMKISEFVLLRKLGLSKRFPRSILHS